MSFDLTHLNGRKLYEREAGILMPIFSLPGIYGTGDLGREARQFVDILHNSNQQMWAMLPNGPVGFGNSPYQAISSCAGNHYFISPEMLINEKLLTKEEAIRDYGLNIEDIDYGKLFTERRKMLECAFQRWLSQGGHCSQDFFAFKFKNYSWLRDYAHYMAIKEEFNYKPWYEWPAGLKNRDKETLRANSAKNTYAIHFWEFTQYKFYQQWEKLKEYANNKGVKLVGDMPFYINHDSSDVWANRELFDLNPDGSIKLFSGLPGPNNTNIRWGNPCYNWQKMRETNYKWFAMRMQKNAEMYDMIRIDHAVAFVHYFGIKDFDTPGVWYDGPDMYNRSVTDVIDCVARQNNMDVIVENLGNNNQRTHDLYDQLNWMGMRIFDYMIGDMRYGARNIHIPSLYPQNVAAYTGTHDNESLVGIIASKTDAELEYLKAYLRVDKREDILWSAVDTLYKSPAAKVILPIQDILSLDDKSRVCYREDYEKSWRWRLDSFNRFDEKIQNKLKGIGMLSSRGWIPEEDVKSNGWQNLFHQAIISRYGHQK